MNLPDYYNEREIRKAILDKCARLMDWRGKVTIWLREKMWVNTHGYEFAADRIVVTKVHDLTSMELCGSYGIHCSGVLLNKTHMTELAGLLPFEFERFVE